MVKTIRSLRKDGRSKTKSSNVCQLVISFVVGCVVMYIYLGPCEIVSSSSASFTDLSAALTIAAAEGPSGGNQQQRQQQQKNEPSEHPDGWHPIHVFYGEESGMGANPDQEWFAQVHQDEILVDLIGNDGYFIDLAANDAVEISNTIALERKGWRGLCIEPNPIYWYGLSHRKCTVVGALVGGTKNKVSVKFRGVYGGIMDKYPKKLADRKREPDAPEVERYTAPIRQILSMYNVPKVIDYMSLDVEGAELMIMEQFPFDEYTIRVMTIERPQRQLKNLLQEKGYIHLKDLAWWGETLWAHTSSGFTPEHPKIAKIKTEERN